MIAVDRHRGRAHRHGIRHREGEIVRPGRVSRVAVGDEAQIDLLLCERMNDVHPVSEDLAMGGTSGNGVDDLP